MIAALGLALPIGGARPVTLAERAYGLRIEHYQAGEQLAWALSSRGVWMGVVRVDIASTNAAVTVASCLWVPAEAITLSLGGYSERMMNVRVRLDRDSRGWSWESVPSGKDGAAHPPTSFPPTKNVN